MVMGQINQKCVALLLLLLIGMINRSLTLAAVQQPASPTLIDVNPSGKAGDYLIGALPPDYDPQRPVLVFVQGLGGNASVWWGPTKNYGDNDMYQYAYKAGYRTAFVNFRDADGNPGDMYVNGAVLTEQLKAICSYFDVAKVVLICHSKGGIDAQTAIVHRGAAPFVSKVITLSTPHRGSQLADLAYSSSASWLSDLIGAKNDGVYVLQTAYMENYRSITDERAENDQIAYYTLAGKDWGPVLSVYYLGGLYLSSYGDNDGAVTVTSAHNPRATHVGTLAANHDNIRMGSKCWRYIEPLLERSTGVARRVFSIKNSQAQNTVNNPVNSDILVKGGVLQADTLIEVPVDSQTTRLNLDFLTASSEVDIEVTDPAGNCYRPNVLEQDDGIFKGATRYNLTVTNPRSGYWRIWASSKSVTDNAYLLIAHYDSGLKISFRTPQRIVKANSAMDFQVNVTGGKLGPMTKAGRPRIRFNFIYGKNKLRHGEDISLRQKESGFEQKVILPAREGLYNVNMDLDGTLEDGSPFARSIIYSMMVE